MRPLLEQFCFDCHDGDKAKGDVNLAALAEEDAFWRDPRVWNANKTEMKSFDLGSYQVAADGPDIAVTTYVVKIDATVDGKDASGTFNSATVWQKQGGEWHAIFHSNVKQTPK